MAARPLSSLHRPLPPIAPGAASENANAPPAALAAMSRLIALSALLLSLALSASAQDCYGPGERNQGAAGFPAVEWKPCCDGQGSAPKDGDWGFFCPAGPDCYGPGERNQGAAGFPAVEYKPCCDGQGSAPKAGDWGFFCPGGDSVIECYGPGQRNQGAAGFPVVEYQPCCDGQASVVKAGDWGFFCPPVGGPPPEPPVGDCYNAGERNQGAANFPAVEYKPCCDGQQSVVKANDWGFFCPPVGGGPVGPPGNGGEYSLSQIPLYIEQNGFGPVERDSSTGEAAAGDGVGMSIAGRAFATGLGVHATSAVGVALQGQCDQFKSWIGVDDETRGPFAIPGGPFGSVTFEVLVDGVSRYKSPVMYGGDAAVEVVVGELRGAQELLLMVGQGDGSFTKDHADWAEAFLTCDGPPNGGADALKATRGEWGPTLQWPVKAIHSSLLPGNGGAGIIISHASKVIGEIGNNDVDFPHDMTKVDSANVGQWDHFWVDRQGVEMYCSGHVVQGGAVLEFGGHGGHRGDFVYHGKVQTSRYEPGNGWTVLQDMRQSRWYPTALTLGNGEILSIGGSNGDARGNIFVPEVYNPATGNWRTLWGVNYEGILVTPDKTIILDDTYPFTALSSDGRVFWAGWDTGYGFIDTAGTGAWAQRGQREGMQRAWASPLLIRTDELLLVGGLDSQQNDGKATDSVVRMKFPGGSAPAIDYVGNMVFPRVDTQATILPDGTAFSNGGGNEHRLGSSPTHIYPGEIFDPATGNWKITAAAKNPRGYHSTALLLPDGRVWTAGGECSAEPTGADNCASGKTAEVYSPPYLFEANGNLRNRPTIEFAPANGQRGAMAITSFSYVARVTMVRVGSSTHHMNFDQRFIEVGFTQGGGNSYDLQIPENTNVVPPGHYLLSIIDDKGTPSVSKFVQFQ